MLYTERSVKDNIRNRDGKRVFFLGVRDSLTSSARDWLQRERIEILPAEKAKITSYRLADGGQLSEKPEHMTHLRGNVLVPKTHPIVGFRGKMDTLQAELLLAQPVVDSATRADLDEILTLARNILRWDVMEEAACAGKLCGLTPAQIREQSHFPQDHYGQPHFMPVYTDGEGILRLNRARCAAREAELAAAHAYQDATGGCAREDILRLLNRMSSMLYLLMIRLKAQQQEGEHYGAGAT